MYWRYKKAQQAALREGDWKYLRIGKHEQLFNLAVDERERAERAVADAERFKAMQAKWAAWNATMLPYPDASTSAGQTTMDRY
jgi:galactose-1-phosphate uridylyltransferase